MLSLELLEELDQSDNAFLRHCIVDGGAQAADRLVETGKRQSEMEHMGAAYMAEGLVTLAGSRLYTSCLLYTSRCV